jgi:hypothetical protein
VSFKCTFVMFHLDFFPFIFWPSFSLTQQLHSNLSPIPHTNPQLPSDHPIYLCWDTHFVFLHNTYLSIMLWCLMYNFNLSNRIESTDCVLKINTFSKCISILVIDWPGLSRSPNSTIFRVNFRSMHFQPFLNLRPETGYLRTIPK